MGIEQRFLPFPFISGPHSIYLAISYLWRKDKNSDGGELCESARKHAFQETGEKELSSRFSEYMIDHQDESSDENHWRLTLKKKVTNLEKELSREMKERMGETEKRMVERIEGMENRMEKRMEGMEKTLGDLVSLLTKK